MKLTRARPGGSDTLRVVKLDPLPARAPARKGLKYSEDQPRDHGRFAESEGASGTDDGAAPTYVSVEVADTETEVRATYLRGFNDYIGVCQARGNLTDFGLDDRSASTTASTMQIDLADPEEVTREQREVCQSAVDEFVNNERMGPVFNAFGMPEFAIASNVIGSDRAGGADPEEAHVLAQWSNGTIFLYGGTAGEPRDVALATQAYEERKASGEAPFAIGASDLQSTLMHEYGHQILGVTGYGPTGDPTEVLRGFVASTMGGGDVQDMTSFERQLAVEMLSEDLSEYAASNPHEAFAEAFAAIMKPDYHQSDYGPAAQAPLKFVHDLLAKELGHAA